MEESEKYKHDNVETPECIYLHNTTANSYICPFFFRADDELASPVFRGPDNFKTSLQARPLAGDRSFRNLRKPIHDHLSRFRLTRSTNRHHAGGNTRSAWPRRGGNPKSTFSKGIHGLGWRESGSARTTQRVRRSVRVSPAEFVCQIDRCTSPESRHFGGINS